LVRWGRHAAKRRGRARRESAAEHEILTRLAGQSPRWRSLAVDDADFRISSAASRHRRDERMQIGSRLIWEIGSKAAVRWPSLHALLRAVAVAAFPARWYGRAGAGR
jgi:hypothetical protein